MSKKIRTQHSSPKIGKPRPDSAEVCPGRAPQNGTPEDEGRADAVSATLQTREQAYDPSMQPAFNQDSHLQRPADLSPAAKSNEAGTFDLDADASSNRPAKLSCLEIPVADLHPHPLNAKIYGDESRPDELLTQSIKDGGVHTPLHVTADNVVIAGHCRLQSARAAGLQTVPAIIIKVDTDEFAAAEYLLETNRARQKTHEQVIREFIEFERIEAGRAKARMQAGKAYPVSNSTQGTLEASTGKARDLAACKVGLSAGTACQGKAVVAALDRLHAAGQAEEERRLRRTLNEESFHAAYKETTRQGWISRLPTRATVASTVSMEQLSLSKSVPNRTASVTMAKTSEGKPPTVDPDLVDGDDQVDATAVAPDQRPISNADGSAAQELDDSRAARPGMLRDKEEVSLSNSSNCIPRAWVEEAFRSGPVSGFREPDNRILPLQMPGLIQKIADLANEMAERNPDFPLLTWHRGIHTANAKLKAVVDKRTKSQQGLVMRSATKI